MKKTKIILVATLGICMLSFMPAVAAKADVRPISAFTDTNPNVAAWSDPESGLSVFPHGFWLFGLYGLESIESLDPHGSVVVKALKGGGILYKVNLHVKGALMFINYTGVGLIFEGLMDYNFQTTLIVYDGELSDPVPNLLYIWFPYFFGIDPIGESPFVHITGSGTGTFLLDAEVAGQSFIAGDTAKVKINQVGFTIPEDHPQSDPDYEPYMYPVEFIFFH